LPEKWRNWILWFSNCWSLTSNSRCN